MTPKIIFHRSWLYDKFISRPDKFKVPPSDAVFEKRINGYNKVWKKEGPRILKELERVTHLKWPEPAITCYVTWGVSPYSDPLTINIRPTPKEIVGTLTHELIHCILSYPSNFAKIENNWKKLMTKYKEYPREAKGHIVIHAIHEHILRRFYGEGILSKEKLEVKSPSYVLAWQIVERDGYKTIIQELTKDVK